MCVLYTYIHLQYSIRSSYSNISKLHRQSPTLGQGTYKSQQVVLSNQVQQSMVLTVQACVYELANEFNTKLRFHKLAKPFRALLVYKIQSIFCDVCSGKLSLNCYRTTKIINNCNKFPARCNVVI